MRIGRNQGAIRRVGMVAAASVLAWALVRFGPEFASWLEARESADTGQHARPATDADVAAADRNVTIAADAGPAPSKSAFPGNDAFVRLQLSRSRFSKNFQFPDGELLTLTFATQGHKAALFDLSSDPRDENYAADLFEAAEGGNSTAARRLTEYINFCTGAPRTDEEFDAAVQAISASPLPQPTIDTAEEKIAALSSVHRACRSVDAAMESKVAELVSASARAGDPRSALLHARQLGMLAPDEAAPYFKIAWDSGYVSGAFGLASVYASRNVASYEEQVKAYGYFYAAYAVSRALYDGLSKDVAAERIVEIENRKTLQESRVSAAVAHDGVEFAKRLLADRPGPFIPM